MVVFIKKTLYLENKIILIILIWNFLIIQFSPNTVVRKFNTDNTLAWMSAFTFWPMMKSLSFDSNEQHVYLASYSSPLIALRLVASTGAIVTAQRL